MSGQDASAGDWTAVGLAPENWCGTCGGRTVKLGMRVVCPSCAERASKPSGDHCCRGECCGPGSWCCAHAGEHSHDGDAERCSLYTARKWAPTSDHPEDDRCVNCGQPEAAHAARGDR